MGDQGSEGLLSPFLRNTRIRAACPYLVGKVLDFGCGAGALAAFVEPHNYVGYDRNSHVLDSAADRYREHRFTNMVPPDVFDTVVALAVLEHVKDPVAALKEWGGLLTPAGRIVLTTPRRSFRLAHDLGAAAGLFSKEAAEEHEEMFERETLSALVTEAGMNLSHYSRFLFGANQLAVIERLDNRSRANPLALETSPTL